MLLERTKKITNKETEEIEIESLKQLLINLNSYLNGDLINIVLMF
jgi:hypothetical protein